MFSGEKSNERGAERSREGNPYNSLRHRIPYRLLGRRSIGAKRLVVSSKVLLPAIPTENCDVVLTFPASTEDATLMWLLARLKSRAPAVTVHVRHHSHTGIYGFYLTAPYDNLLQGAEELGLLKPLKTEYGGGMKEFVYEDHDCFAGLEDESSFLTSQERQSIVLHFLNELRATGDDSLAGINFVEGQAIVPLLITKKVISQVFPLHNNSDLKELRQKWVRAVCSIQPLDMVCRYFGVKIGLYFAFLGHYTTWLILPTLIGIIIFFMQGFDQACILLKQVFLCVKDKDGTSGKYVQKEVFTEDLCFVGFALFNVVWAALFMKFWNRASIGFCYRWGTLEKKDEMLKDPRPLFTGDLGKSPVTGHMEIQYPAWKRLLFRHCITVPVIAMCLVLVFFTMLLCFELQEWVNELIANDDLPYVFSFLPKVVLAIVVSIFDEIYKTIALWLTNKENYRLEESHETSLIIKMVLFQFVNSFLSLFYIGFYLNDMDRLRDQLAALLITRQVLGNIKEALFPYVIWKAKLYSVGYKMATRMSPASVEKEVMKMTSHLKHEHSKPKGEKQEVKKRGALKHSDSENSQINEEEDEGLPTLTQAEVESAMKTYESTLDDYLEMCIQFGYITLFSPAFPLAAFCALVNNIIEIRSDAFKLCLTHQRPFGQRVHSIGIWEDVLMVFSILAIIVNCALVGTSGLLQRMYPGLSPSVCILVIVILEHLIISMKFVLARLIPNMPPVVATEMARLEYKRTEALKQLVLQSAPHHPGASHLVSHYPCSPNLRRRKVGESEHPDPTQSQSSPTVITPTGPPSRPSDIPLSSGLGRPKVPPRTSLQAATSSTNPFITSASASIADKVVSESLNPVLAPGIKPRMSESGNGERSRRQAVRMRAEKEIQRRRSEPVSSAVTTAVNLHKQIEESGLTRKSIYENQEDLSSSQSDESSGEMRRRRSRDKHGSHFELSMDRKEGPTGEKLVSSKSDKNIKISPVVTSLPPSIPSSSTTSSSSSLTSLKYCASPRLLRGGVFGDPSSLAMKVLSRKSRSFSSADVNEARQAFRDRLSWRGELPFLGRIRKGASSTQKEKDSQASKEPKADTTDESPSQLNVTSPTEGTGDQTVEAGSSSKSEQASDKGDCDSTAGPVTITVSDNSGGSDSGSSSSTTPKSARVHRASRQSRSQPLSISLPKVNKSE